MLCIKLSLHFLKTGKKLTKLYWGTEWLFLVAVQMVAGRDKDYLAHLPQTPHPIEKVWICFLYVFVIFLYRTQIENHSVISLSSQEMSSHIISLFLCACSWHFNNMTGIKYTTAHSMNLAIEVSKCSAF